ncbi:hypothetical protein [Kineosporia babensis]|uniref:GNAT family N-acetyltransferase n=1 Tax=Kineosporia babensis TaxID=499548 RepID=A0A9X1NAZ6_9ACTN|nr:hypothetical protein [Kineosporia babensis]MCD5310775.1 hypothetical protein [Kineosporia babensis]
MERSKGTADARRSAQRAAARAGVSVRALGSTADSFVCERFLAEVWQTEPGAPPLAADVIKAMADAGAYVAGAFDGEQLLAACVGLWGPPDHPEMHSHIAGVLTSARRRDVGFALKLDQRAHVLEHGAHEITWTFDPLIARNAHFNFRKLGGGAQQYLIDHYGQLPDGLNGADPSDRLLLRWELLGERARAACDGDGRLSTTPDLALLLGCDDERPVSHTTDAQVVVVAVPSDIEALRRQDPALAAEWRTALREVLGGLLSAGASLIDFDRTAGGYVLVRGER